MIRRISLTATLFVFWLLLSGHYTPYLITVGLICAVVITLVSEKVMGVLDSEGHPVQILGRAIPYWGWLLVEMAKSAWDVSKRIVGPSLPISPTLIRVKTTQKTDVGRVTYANSITLTPGTISLALEGDEILVHALSRDAAEGLAGGDMDRRVTRVEGGQ